MDINIKMSTNRKNNNNISKVKLEPLIDRKRKLDGFWEIFVRIVAILMSIIFIYAAGFGSFPALKQRSLFILLGLVIIFIVYPFNPNKKERVSIIDIILVILTIIVFSWIWYDFNRLVTRFPYVHPVYDFELLFGTIAVLLILEANRRTMGWPLVLVTIGALIYNFIGPWIPGVFHHTSCTFSYFIDHIYLTTEGMFSNIIGIASTYIFIFILFGSFLDITGMGQFFIDFCNCIAGKYPGGPAKTAVLASAAMGSISGSGVANVVTTGTFTIPLMKKVGYTPAQAAAVEAAASNGGQLLPPVMGIAAFIMAEFTGIPYIEIVKNGAIPAIVYFFVVYIFVDLMAKQAGLSGLPLDKIPSMKKVLNQGGHLVIPLIILVYLLLKGYTPYYAGFLCIIATFIVSFRNKETALIPSKIIKSLEEGAFRVVGLVSAAACAGLILGVASQTGVGVRISSIVLTISKGNLFITICLVGAIAYILGMGLTCATAYIITAILAAPALVELGVPLLAAHFIVFWFSQTSNVTPPVCLAAYAAATIAGAKPMETGFKSLKLSIGMVVIPFLFAYTPIIFYSFETTVAEYIWHIITLVISLSCFAIATEGYFTKSINIYWRILFGISAITIFFPSNYTKVIGLVILGGTLIIYKMNSLRKAGASNHLKCNRKGIC